MIKLRLESTSMIKGSKVPLVVEFPEWGKYQNIQIEVYDVAVKNPVSKLGFGTTPEMVSDIICKTKINTSHLQPGDFEIKLVRFHNEEDIEPLDFIAERDFERTIFEVRYCVVKETPRDQIYIRTFEKEKELENEFLTRYDVRHKIDAPSELFLVLVFVKDILIGTRVRFSNFELAPTGKGIEELDQLNFINQHLRDSTSLNLSFLYDDSTRNRAQSLNPVCIVHFPCLLANTHENAKDYSVYKTEKLISALSLTRGAIGKILDIVVYNRESKQAKRFAENRSYVGNLLTGNLAGENADTLETYTSSLEDYPFNNFVVGLYRDANREKCYDFRYVRLWQVLEILAENQNYDPEESLLDFDGDPITEDGRELKVNGSVQIVFHLFKINGIGQQVKTWKKVNTWFAFRSAVAHYGEVSNYPELRPKFRAYAEIAYQEIQDSNGHDQYLMSLKEDTKLLLMRLLSGCIGQNLRVIV